MYLPAMSKLHDEIRDLAEQVAGGPDEVADLGADVAAWYRRERLAALGLAAVDSMLEPGAPLQAKLVIDENDPRLDAVRLRLRDRLRGVVAWARETGRMP